MAKHRPAKFPRYLPKPNLKDLRWLGERLRKIKRKAVPQDVPVAILNQLENGHLHIGLGQLRYILKNVYQVGFDDLLRDLAVERGIPLGAGVDVARPFFRDRHYGLRLEDFLTEKTTPLFVGGPEKNFLWATPFREMRNKSLCTEYLELAPYTKSSGETPVNVHPGAEVIIPVYGTVEVLVEGPDGFIAKPIQPENAFQLNSAASHFIRNRGTNSCALLIVVRTIV